MHEPAGISKAIPAGHEPAGIRKVTCVLCPDNVKTHVVTEFAVPKQMDPGTRQGWAFLKFIPIRPKLADSIGKPIPLLQQFDFATGRQHSRHSSKSSEYCESKK